MGRNDRLGDFNQRVKCQNCGKDYLQYREDQLAGFRMKDDDICPYCGYVNATSLEFEFTNYPIVE